MGASTLQGITNSLLLQLFSFLSAGIKGMHLDAGIVHFLLGKA